MVDANVASYGCWKSPVTTDLIVAEATRFGLIALDGSDIYWLESRPTEKGRGVIVRRSANGALTDITPSNYSVRSRVHEYGGGDFVVHAGVVYFVNDEDQRLYRQVPGMEPVVMAALEYVRNTRFADLAVDPLRQRLLCVSEDHSHADREPVNVLVSLPLNNDDAAGMHILLAGNNFYTTPRLSPDQKKLAWLTWNHPNMPWDGCELWVADLDEHGFVSSAQMVAGGPQESIFQPSWSPDGLLYFVSDRTGWWNLYRLQGGYIEPIYPKDAEFGLPQWLFGMSTYGFISAERLVCWSSGPQESQLAMLNTSTLEIAPIAMPYTEVSNVQVNDQHVVFFGASPTSTGEIVRLDPETGQTKVVRRTQTAVIEPEYISDAQAVEFPTTHERTAYGYYYQPKNALFQAPEGERPPLLVLSHGGPTAATSRALNWKIQFWTSRGFAVLDVNYGGSTGYGRAYRERLLGQWGIVDVDDCCQGALYLVSQGLADPLRLTIQGGSAGGYTTLSALTFRDTFKAGASYYGISDLEVLAQDTHKFESRYNDSLLGPYPEMRYVYYERSPIHFTDQLSCPIIFFQGLEDRVVPPNQAELMVEALRNKGLPVAYLAFEGEGHGFRQAENIKRALEAQLYFFGQVLGFTPADTLTPVKIENL